MGVLDAEIQLVFFHAHRIANIPADLRREHDLSCNPIALRADKVDKALGLEFLRADAEWCIPDNRGLIGGIKLAVKDIDEILIGIDAKRKDLEAGDVKAEARTGQSDRDIGALVQADTQIKTLEQVAFVKAQADIAAVKVIIDLAILIAFPSGTRAGVAEKVDEEEQIANVVGRKMVKRNGLAHCFFAKAIREGRAATHLVAIAVMQLYLGGGKVGLCDVGCRKTGNKCQSAKQISDMFFHVSLFRK